jgi:hypothetical protein
LPFWSRVVVPAVAVVAVTVRPLSLIVASTCPSYAAGLGGGRDFRHRWVADPVMPVTVTFS